MVQIFAFAEEPERVAGADPVVPVVLRIAVAGDDFVAVGEGAVDGFDVARVEHVVRVEDREGVERLFAVVADDVFVKKFERVAFADFFAVEALVDDGAVRARDGGGGVGAVVRRDEDGDAFPRVRLAVDAVEKVLDDGLLVARGNEDREARGLGGLVRLVLQQKREREVEELVEVAQQENRAQQDVDRREHDVPRSVFRLKNLFHD